MPLIQPFRALRPAPGRAAEVLAPPYDVLSSAEARERAKRQAVELPAHLQAGDRPRSGDRPVRSRASTPRRRRTSTAWSRPACSIRDAKPCYYVYRLTWRDRTQTGLAGVASLADYDTNRIRKHELTTPVKEDDRVRQIEAVNAQTGPVMIGYPRAPEIDAMLASAAGGRADVDVTADDGVRHQLWVVRRRRDHGG